MLTKNLRRWEGGEVLCLAFILVAACLGYMRTNHRSAWVMPRSQEISGWHQEAFVSSITTPPPCWIMVPIGLHISWIYPNPTKLVNWIWIWIQMATWRTCGNTVITVWCQGSSFDSTWVFEFCTAACVPGHEWDTTDIPSSLSPFPKFFPHF